MELTNTFIIMGKYARNWKIIRYILQDFNNMYFPCGGRWLEYSYLIKLLYYFNHKSSYFAVTCEGRESVF